MITLYNEIAKMGLKIHKTLKSHKSHKSHKSLPTFHKRPIKSFWNTESIQFFQEMCKTKFHANKNLNFAQLTKNC